MTASHSIRQPVGAGSFSVSAVRDLFYDSQFRVVAFVAIHPPLALLIYQFQLVAALHAFATLSLGLGWAMSGRRQFHRVAYVGAYIAGSEVLWRMKGAVFYEYGKYATAAIFITAMLRSQRLKGPGLATLYLLLLLPSVMLVNFDDLTVARKDISFHMSGHLALIAGAWFFSQLKLTPEQTYRTFLSVIGPTVGLAAVTLFSTVTNPNIVFNGESNLDTSGGFGPNQVSGALGLGVLMAFLYIMNGRETLKIRALMFGAMVLMAVQSALTFSRGGLYNAAGGIALASFYLVKDPRSRIKLVFFAALLLLTANYIVWPRLDTFTGGALSARFQNTDSTGRDEVVRLDLQTWMENPILGVGPGQRHGTMAHTEFTRLVSEHGTFGAVAVLLLLMMMAQNLKRARTTRSKAIVASITGWSLLFMLDKAMRMVAPAFALGLTFATFLPEKKVRRFYLTKREHKDTPMSGRPVVAVKRRLLLRRPTPVQSEIDKPKEVTQCVD
jgi:O-antigen ligase/polysaccharide polymerase Wzy-like membrane protein